MKGGIYDDVILNTKIVYNTWPMSVRVCVCEFVCVCGVCGVVWCGVCVCAMRWSDVSFDVNQDKLLTKQSTIRWIEMSWRSFEVTDMMYRHKSIHLLAVKMPKSILSVCYYPSFSIYCWISRSYFIGVAKAQSWSQPSTKNRIQISDWYFLYNGQSFTYTIQVYILRRNLGTGKHQGSWELFYPTKLILTLNLLEPILLTRFNFNPNMN